MMCGHDRSVPESDDRRHGRGAATLVRAKPSERVTDQERQRAVEQLRLHVGAGRLTLDEFGERVDEALGARTGAELRVALRELPRMRTAAERRRQQRAVVTPYLVVSALLVFIWAASGFGFPWPVFPLVGWGLPVLGEWSRLRRKELTVAA